MFSRMASKMLFLRGGIRLQEENPMNKYLRLNRFVSFGPIALAAAVLLTSVAANATPYVMRLVQQGSSVVAMGNGAFDVSGLTPDLIGFPAGMNPSFGEILVGNGSGGFDAYITPLTGPGSFGTGGITDASSESGDVGTISAGVGGVGVPIGYVSGTAIAGTATWDNATFASLGVTPGTYIWTWGTGADQSFTLMIGGPISAPEPAALGIFGLGLLLIGAVAGLRRRIV